MRIIAGTHRGRTLHAPRGTDTTRPVTDRVKEALFNRLHSLGALDGDLALDIYSGTGSMGLEALSRGVQRCVFVDADRDAVGRLRMNLADFELADRAEVRPTDALAGLYLAGLADASVCVVFLDPPYADVTPQRERLASLLDKLHPKLEPGGIVVLRTPSDASPPEAGAFDLASVRYGGMTLHFYQRPL